MCARLKEETLELAREDDNEERLRKAGFVQWQSRTYFTNYFSVIQAHAEAQWLALPPQFRLEGPLKLCDRKPIERDFLVGAKLCHLHVLFLVQLALARHIQEPSSQLVSTSAKMLSLVIEAVVLKDSLVNSGTGLVWKESWPII